MVREDMVFTIAPVSSCTGILLTVTVFPCPGAGISASRSVTHSATLRKGRVESRAFRDPMHDLRGGEGFSEES